MYLWLGMGENISTIRFIFRRLLIRYLITTYNHNLLREIYQVSQNEIIQQKEDNFCKINPSQELFVHNSSISSSWISSNDKQTSSYEVRTQFNIYKISLIRNRNQLTSNTTSLPPIVRPQTTSNSAVISEMVPVDSKYSIRKSSSSSNKKRWTPCKLLSIYTYLFIFPLFYSPF